MRVVDFLVDGQSKWAVALFLICTLSLTACGQDIPSCDADQVTGMAEKMWKDQLGANALAKEIVDVARSKLVMEDIKTVKEASEIRECSCRVHAQLVLTPAGAKYERGGGILPTAFISAIQKPYDLHYVVRMNDDRSTFTAEFFGEAPPQ